MKKNYILWTNILLIFFIVELFYALTCGSADISIYHVYQAIKKSCFSNLSVTAPGQGAVHDIIWLLRMPRLLLAATTGAGLAVCGAVIQAIVKNPLADPYILGISSGASLGAVIAIFFGIGITYSINFIGIAAFIGALLISILVIILAGIKNYTNSVKLLLIGIALNMVCSSIVSFIIYFASDKEGIQTVTFWLMGSFSGIQWNELKIIIPITIITVLFFWTQNRILDIMLLGDQTAITLGINLQKYRQIYLLISAFNIGFIVYAAGMIGFVGLVIPHIVRIFVGSEHKYLIPLSALLGAILLVFADILCRILIPNTEIPVGIMISFIGTPVFIILILKKSYSFGENR